MSDAMEDNATIGEAMADDRLAAIHDVNVDIYAVLGKSTMLVSQLLKIGRGAIIELDQKTTDPIEIQVNNELVAKGEIVTVDDNLGVTITEIVKKAAS
jgi:flagellar motor switch protein FliN